MSKKTNLADEQDKKIANKLVMIMLILFLVIVVSFLYDEFIPGTKEVGIFFLMILIILFLYVSYLFTWKHPEW